jgi:hypothetical protein
MASGRNRQKFGQTLDDPEDERLDEQSEIQILLGKKRGDGKFRRPGV